MVMGSVHRLGARLPTEESGCGGASLRRRAAGVGRVALRLLLALLVLEAAVRLWRGRDVGMYLSLRDAYNGATVPAEYAYIEGRCRWAWWSAPDVHYSPGPAERERASLVLVFPTRECNIFHQLWLWVNVLDHVVRHKALPLVGRRTERVDLHLGLHACMAWMEPIVAAHPASAEAALAVHVHLLGGAGDKAAGVAYDEKMWAPMLELAGSPAPASPDNCAFAVHQHWDDFFPSHESWEGARYPPNAYFAKWMEHFRKANALAPSSESCDRAVPRIAFLERRATRRLVDATSRQSLFDVLLPRVVELGYSMDRVYLEDLTPREQAAEIASANVLLGAHGAGLTNAIYMPVCSASSHFKSAVVEVSLRFGFCTDADYEFGVLYDRAKLLEVWGACSARGRYYHKADFFALAKTLDYTRFVEVVNEERGTHINRDDGNPLHMDELVVKAEKVLVELRRLKLDNAYDYRGQGAVQERGVEPYTIS